MGILGNSNKTEIGPFFRKDVQHEKMELSDQLQATLDFLNKTWSDFLVLFKDEYVRDVYTENRRHSISGVRQQKLKEESDQNLSYAYISTEKDFDSMPDEIYILLISDREESVYAHECPFDTILITGEDNINVLGRYYADQIIGDDCLLHYRKYVKDKTVVGGVCMAYLSQEKNKMFYHSNPYFDVESVSNDEEFLKRIMLPF